MTNNIFSLLMSAKDPQAFLLNMIQQQNRNNPIMSNLIDMANSNNTQGIEALARNLCKERGVDPDEMFRNVSNQIRRK